MEEDEGQGGGRLTSLIGGIWVSRSPSSTPSGGTQDLVVILFCSVNTFKNFLFVSPFLKSSFGIGLCVISPAQCFFRICIALFFPFNSSWDEFLYHFSAQLIPFGISLLYFHSPPVLVCMQFSWSFNMLWK